MGLTFPNRLGLAAGFDKNAVAVNGIGHLGLGCIEVGTVTPIGQPGNPAPRLFRLVEERGLINRAGFPNDGAVICAERLRSERRYPGMLGISIGKNASTPLDDATADYIAMLRAVHDVADYVAINISSPNTAQLRELHAKSRLQPLLEALVLERERLTRGRAHPLPLVLKLSPDLDDAALSDVCSVLRPTGIDGVIATNTTIARDAVPRAREVVGGLSGAPLRPYALRCIRDLRARLGPDYPLIGSGGILSGEHARAVREAGADLVQLYTGLVYRGPRLIQECLQAAG